LPGTGVIALSCLSAHHRSDHAALTHVPVSEGRWPADVSGERTRGVQRGRDWAASAHYAGGAAGV